MFTFEYVEPYSNGSCHSYTNCLQCLSDSLCGWCDPSQRCLPRVIHRNMTSPDDILPECYLEGNTTAFLILNPLQCTNCSNHISCHHCVEDGLCEWLVDEASCTRRGRFANAVHSLNECPVPCHQRDNCAACLGEPGRCTWCEETQVIDFFYFQNMFRVYWKLTLNFSDLFRFFVLYVTLPIWYVSWVGGRGSGFSFYGRRKCGQPNPLPSRWYGYFYAHSWCWFRNRQSSFSWRSRKRREMQILREKTELFQLFTRSGLWMVLLRTCLHSSIYLVFI